MTGAERDPSCEAVRELAPDVALDLSAGEERAAVLDHLEGCEGCRAEVASLAVAVDEVLLAAPRVAPPPGFAARVVGTVLDEAGRDGRPAEGGLPAVFGQPRHLRRRRRGRIVAAAAAAALVLVAGLVAAGLVGRDQPTEPEVAVAAMVSERGRDVGTATATAEDGGSTVVTVDLPGWTDALERWGGAPAGSYWLVVSQRDGSRTMRALEADVAGWSMEVEGPLDAVVGVSMVDDDGRVWCTGTFARA